VTVRRATTFNRGDTARPGSASPAKSRRSTPAQQLPKRPAQLVESYYGPSWHSSWITLS